MRGPAAPSTTIACRAARIPLLNSEARERAPGSRDEWLRRASEPGRAQPFRRLDAVTAASTAFDMSGRAPSSDTASEFECGCRARARLVRYRQERASRRPSGTSCKFAVRRESPQRAQRVSQQTYSRDDQCTADCTPASRAADTGAIVVAVARGNGATQTQAAFGGRGPQTSGATAFMSRDGCLRPLSTQTSTAARRETTAGRLPPLSTQTSSAVQTTTADGRLRAPPITPPADAHSYKPCRDRDRSHTEGLLDARPLKTASRPASDAP